MGSLGSGTAPGIPFPLGSPVVPLGKGGLSPGIPILVRVWPFSTKLAFPLGNA